MSEDIVIRVFRRLQNKYCKLAMPVLIRNLVGSFEETVDGQIKALKQLYIDVI